MSSPFQFVLIGHSSPARITLACGDFRLVLDRDSKDLWVAAETQKESNTVQASSLEELFGFGSGDWVNKSTARDVMTDCSDSGRWLPFCLKDGSQKCILEMDRRSPDHVKKADLYNKVLWIDSKYNYMLFWFLKTASMLKGLYFWFKIPTYKSQVTTFKDVFATLETLGEVNVKVSMHDLTKSDAGVITFNQAEPVCFVLDQPKEKRKKARFLLTNILQHCMILYGIFVLWHKDVNLLFQSTYRSKQKLCPGHWYCQHIRCQARPLQVALIQESGCDLEAQAGTWPQKRQELGG